MNTLDEHNESKGSGHRKPNNLSGVACNNCLEEMLHTNPNVILTSYPAQQEVKCPKCGDIGYKIV